MGLTAAQIADLVATTQKNLGKMKWTDLMHDLQEFHALPRILKKKKATFQSGTAIQYNVLTDHGDNARNVGLFSVDNVNQRDGMQQAEVPWRHTETSYGFDRRQISMNRSPSKIVDFVKEKRAMSMASLAEKLEENFWTGAVASTDTDTPFGIQYWITTNSSEGFNGGNHSGFASGPANLDCDTYGRWKNWTAQYAAVSKTDLIRKWRKAARFTKFKSPTSHPDYNTGDKYGFYTNHDVLGTLEEQLETQNDNLGNDIASKDGNVLFHRIPVEWVPFLEDDTTDPVYGINWGVFKPVFLKGEYLREDPPHKAPNQHNVMQAFTDLTYNVVCYDRRRLFVLYK
jgi:hypothetical protein